jgi:nicotinamide-nucleotide amidase
MRMPEINARQALVLEGATVLDNPKGTAPGLLIKEEKRTVVLLPGPPRELQPMFDQQVVPRLSPAAGARQFGRRVIKMTGRSESQVEEVAFPIYSKLGSNDVSVQTTILATPGQIELHLAAKARVRRLQETCSVSSQASSRLSSATMSARPPVSLSTKSSPDFSGRTS